MDAWLTAYALPIAIAAVVLLVAAILFLVLWLSSARARSRQLGARVSAQRDALELELSLQEELGRLRIVRELGEVAVHTVSVIISQADGAQYAAKSDRDAATRATVVIAEMGRAALADLRRIMTIVRDGEAAASPQPRLKTARDLFKVMRDAGLEVEFVESGERFDLQEGAELAIFRILQEALTNALKFGGDGAHAKVSFTWTEEGLQVLVDDDGARMAARRQGLDPNEAAQQRAYTIDEDLNALTEVVSGRGISEMRDRTELYGGIFNAYAVPGVGFSVSAMFPALRYDNGVHGVNLGS
ncbi:MAG: ATP-binding protein [Microbacteriaceae bacterium]|jgi:signal transduction histidine kinase|nr:ATP-binding protein [Microbacteriaceae bacterium]